MFVDPTTAVSVALVWIRELGTIGLIAIVGWNARAAFQFFKDFYTDAKVFMTDVKCHMQRMENFAQRVETNHLKHMELYLYKIAKDRNKTALTEPDLVAFDDVPPPQEDEADARPI